MSDLTLAQLKHAYDAALEQIAAESFLFQGMGEQAYIDALRRGNNPGADPGADNLDGKLRMTLEQAQVFESRYDIIDAYQNDATGFSAVALRDTDNPGRVVLAVRSTEINNDTARDVGADFQIFTSGFAFDQILSAQDFLNRVQPKLLPGEKIDLVGYSLSGNVVRTLAAMYPTDVNQASGASVVFNATGLGGFSDPTGQNRPRSVVLLEMMSLYRQVEADPNSVTDVPLLLQPLQLTAIAASPIDRTDPNGNVYPSPRNDFAEAYIQNKYTTFYNDFGTTVSEISFAQYFGVAMSGFDAAAVANSGSHPVPVGVAIEGQPVANIPGVASRFEYLNTHSLTLIADSLRLQMLFKEIDPTLSLDDIQTIFQASSASSANTLLGRAEKDTLENALDAVRKTLLPIDPSFQPTPSSEAASGFGLISNRTVFHTNITAVENVLPPQPSPYRIESLVNRPLEEVKGNALLEDVGGKGLAYRYALKELNPFAIIGPTYAQHNPNGELVLFNPDTGLGTITTDYIQDRGLFLVEKIALNQSNRDIPLNSFALTHYHDNTTGYDIPSGLTIPPGIQREYIFGSDIAETISGGSLFANDHLYGGDGVDTLLGNGGNDYLQGDAGNDTLDGGSGADRMVGGQGNDTYIVDHAGDSVTEGLTNGSDTVESSVTFAFTTGDNLEDLTLIGTNDINATGNELDNLITGNDGINRLDGQGGTDHLIGGDKDDILIGGTGNNDLLEGGAGFDTYIYNNGDGIDQIEDSDARGKIVFNGGLLQGGISTDGGDTYVSLDGTETYILSGGHLIVNGALTVNADFQSGQFGIHLRDVSEANYDNGYPDIVRVGTPAADTFGILGLVNNIIHYGGGDDVDIGERGNDQLFGEEGNDVLEGNTGDDRLSGGAGNDFLRGDNVTAPGPAFNLGTDAVWGRDVLDGGDGDDTLIGDWGDDILRGGVGIDLLYGDSLSAAQGTASANDFLDGGEGNDELHGQEGDDVLYGGTGNDVLSGEAGDDVEDGGAGNDLLLAYIGNDSLAGGAGLDTLYGDVGNDILDGGDDADTLYGGDGSDQLYGGRGADILLGDHLNNPSEFSTVGAADVLDGGAGNDHLEGGIGDDTLFGGSEHDVLFGDAGTDVLAGDDGDDELQGGADHDQLFGDAGTDRLFGQAGDDNLAGGIGDDLLVGDVGNDFLDGEAGVDRLEGGAGQDILAGGAGNDTLLGEADDDQLFGDDGDDILNGGEGNNLLIGGEGNDQLIGGSGIDQLEGGTGNDTLVGGGGADTIIYDGQGQDILTADANDRLELTNGLTSTTVLAGRTGNNLVLTVDGTADRLTVQSFFASPVNQMSQLRFADGTVWDTATIITQSSRILFGTEGNDILQAPDGLGYTLHGFGGNDVLFGGGGLDTVDGGAGLDLLRGGAGADTLLGGEGNDSLEGEDGNDLLIGGTGDDQLHGGAGADQLLGGDGDDSMTGDADDILLDGGAGLDRIFFQGSVGVTFDLGAGHFEYANATDGHDTLTAASVVDAVQLFGNSGDDQLTGGFGNDLLAGGDGTDTLWGRGGADQLEGGAGADTYLFGLGDGHDGILDSAVVDGSADDEDGGGGGGPTIEQNRVVFGAGILSDALRLSFDPILSSLPGSVGTLQLTVNTTDAILLSNFDPSDPFGPHAIETFEFADGTSLTYAQLVARGFDLTGTEGGDTIVGTILADRISGLHGEDVLRAGFGDDQLDGGTGNDQLLGGFGHDTYVFADGSGQDLLFDPAGHDTVRMGEGIAAEDIQGTREGHDLVLIVQSTGDSLRLQHFYLGETFQVEDVRFADGTVWDRARLLVSTQRQILGTDGIDVLTGGPPDDLISGFAGNDTLLGLAGTDLLDGGTGADTMAGGSGDDTYVVDDAGDVVTEQLNEGADTIHSSITYQLGSNVERLTLEGSGNVDGTGNQLDNVLIGNSAANVFTGGTGNDTYVIGAGDTVVEQVNEGMDTVVTDQSYTLGTYVEHLTLTGSGNVKGTGNALDNVLTGNSGTNVLTGGAGSDIYVIGVGDTVVEASNEGNDTVMTDHSYTLGVNVEQLTLTGNQAINGTGNELDNVLQGNRSINVLAGGLGNDLYLVGLGDIVLESAGEGTDTIQTAQSYTLGTHVEHLTLLDGPHPALAVSLTPDTGIPAEVGPSINFTGTGNELDNHLFGNRADNVLEGQGGSDVLDGGAGNDTLKGGEGADTYLFGLGSGHDRIDDQSLAGEIDTIRLAPGILPTQIGVVQSGMDLVLRMPGSRDELALGNFFRSSASAKKVVQFEDGTVWDEATLGALGADPGPGIFFTDPGNIDVLVGTTGNDELRGTSGNDTITGGAGHDILRDNIGSNVLDGGAGDDQLFGSSGNDIFVFGRGYGHDAVFVDQIFFGGPLGFLWSDLLTTDTDTIQMVGLHPDDVTIQRQFFQSGQFKFTITLLDSADQLTLWFRNGTYGFAPAPVTLQFADGSSQALGLTSSFPVAPSLTVLSSVNYTLNETQENLILLDLNSSVISNPGIGTGNALDNVLLGNTADNVLDGGAGNDVVNGGFPRSVENQLFIDTGSDVLLGGEGDDLLIPFGDVVFGFEIGVGGDPNRFNTPDDVLLGGPGHDTYLIRHAGQIIGEREGEGIDMVHSTVSYTLSDHVENLVLIPTAIDDDLGLPGLIGTGNTLDNVLIGGGGEDLLVGGAGHDTLYGGSARSGGDIDDDGIPDAVPVNDTLVGGTGHDTYVFNVGDGLDTIDDTVTVGEGNRIQFGLNIGQSDLTFVHDEAARTLMIQVGNSGTDQLILKNFNPTGADGSLVVETLAFADGTTASLAALLGLGGPVNHAPTVANALADQTVLEDAPFSIQVPANTFADEDVIHGDTVTYSASLATGNALPTWLSFNATTRTFTGTLDDAQVGSLDLRVTATDRGNLSVSDVFTLAVTNVNEAPTVAMPLADQQAAEDASFNFVAPANIFADVDHVHGDQLAYRATLSDGSALPSWLNFDSATRTFSGTPLNGDVGILNINVTATDGGALSATDSFALTVQNVNDAPTVAAPLADQTAAEDSAFIFTVSSAAFTDEDLIHGDVLTYRATLADGSALPTWLGFDPATRTFSGTPGAGDAGTIHITVTATDAESLSGTALFTLNVTQPLPQTVIGTTGNDVLTGGRGDDTLSGLAGHDLLDGDEGSDRMTGGAGNDTYLVDASGDVVTELPNEGFDTVIADVTTALSANVEALVLTGSLAIDGMGNSLNNGLTGNNASNTLDGGSGADVMAGLDGDDTYVVDRSSDLVVELANHGIDTVQSAVTYALAANLEHLTLTGAAAIHGTGNALDNILVGNSAANRLTGGAGNDTYVVGAGDTVVESSNSGTDTVHSSVTWTLGSNLEHLTLTGSSAINGTGNSAANVLTGNSANNVLNGANGADTLRGGLGNDTVNGGSGNDTFLFGRGDGQDLVQDNSGTADKLLYDAGINPLDLVISRQANNLRLSIHGSTDHVTIQNWYTSSVNRTETIQAGNGQTLLNTQVDQLIQAMAGFTQQTGLTWDQAIDQRPQNVQTVLAASWQ
ncbi:MAG: hypothetical protein E8D41_00810 [Nitrospira sp.]|nr:MAG: hypothetical protein E8D41_00810 [Nitrospira sp.]